MKVKVSERIYEGLEVVRESGLTNMLDSHRVAELCRDFGFPETAEFVVNNRTAYSEGFFNGFEVVPDKEENDE